MLRHTPPKSVCPLTDMDATFHHPRPASVHSAPLPSTMPAPSTERASVPRGTPSHAAARDHASEGLRLTASRRPGQWPSQADDTTVSSRVVCPQQISSPPLPRTLPAVPVVTKPSTIRAPTVREGLAPPSVPGSGPQRVVSKPLSMKLKPRLAHPAPGADHGATGRLSVLQSPRGLGDTLNKVSQLLRTHRSGINPDLLSNQSRAAQKALERLKWTRTDRKLIFGKYFRKRSS